MIRFSGIVGMRIVTPTGQELNTAKNVIIDHTAHRALGLLVTRGGWAGGARVLNGAALIYGLLMAVPSAMALALAFRDGRFAPLAAGTLLFMVSDTVLGNRVIRGHFWPRVNDLVWVTYNLAQLLIAYSTAAAANALAGA